jgi:ribosomal protein L34
VSRWVFMAGQHRVIPTTPRILQAALLSIRSTYAPSSAPRREHGFRCAIRTHNNDPLLRRCRNCVVHWTMILEEKRR